MPTPTEVHAQLTDICVRVLGCDAEAVVPAAVLKTDLGVDSLTVVEIGEELGRRFDVYLSDDTIDGLVSVKDAVDAVVRHDGATLPVGAAAVPRTLAPPTPEVPPIYESVEPPAAPPVRSRDNGVARGAVASRGAILLALVGAALGGVLGLGGAALVGATGLASVDLPPLSMPTTEATTATPTPTPAPATTDATAEPEPTLNVSSSTVSPGERFGLEGAFPALGEGATLQVQVKDKGSDWDDFPVDTKTRDGGKYKTQIYTSRTGERQFRMLHVKSGKASPAVTVEIG